MRLEQGSVPCRHLKYRRLPAVDEADCTEPHLKPLFDRAIARDELSPQTDLQLLFEMLLGVLFVRVYVLGESLDSTLAERIVDLLLSGGALSLPEKSKVVIMCWSDFSSFDFSFYCSMGLKAFSILNPRYVSPK